MKACRVLSAALAFVIIVSGCGKPARSYATWSSRGESPGRWASVDIEGSPPSDAAPWAGTVSHHLLADAMIDRWFLELARRRKVELFYVLSPSHWGLSTQPYSIADGAWRTTGGMVESDRGKAADLADKLGVALDPAVFDYEHGVSVLIPYIERYFPTAKVVAIACNGEPPVDQPKAARLTAALEPAFRSQMRDKNFLLISADFSHHGDMAETAERDDRTRLFFTTPSASTWIYSVCDNRPGMYALAHLLDAGTLCSVLYHCNSFTLSGREPDNITSYFFSFFWDVDF